MSPMESDREAFSRDDEGVLSRFAIAQGSRAEELEVPGKVGVEGLHVLQRL